MSKWCDVLNGIFQGSILGPILCIIYINDLIESCGDDAEICVFADDVRLSNLSNHITSRDDAVALQSKSDNFSNWSEKSEK